VQGDSRFPDVFEDVDDVEHDHRSDAFTLGCLLDESELRRIPVYERDPAFVPGRVSRKRLLEHTIGGKGAVEARLNDPVPADGLVLVVRPPARRGAHGRLKALVRGTGSRPVIIGYAPVAGGDDRAMAILTGSDPRRRPPGSIPLDHDDAEAMRRPKVVEVDPDRGTRGDLGLLAG
jgi:hypothetical protein